MYPSSTNVVLIDQEGQLKHTLSLWDALPHRAGPSEKRDVKGVVARDDMVSDEIAQLLLSPQLTPDRGMGGHPRRAVELHRQVGAALACRCISTDL